MVLLRCRVGVCDPAEANARIGQVTDLFLRLLLYALYENKARSR